MSLAKIGRYQRALDGAASVILAGLGLVVSASLALVGV